MDYSAQLVLSYYKTIATLNEEHKVYLVQHLETKEIFVKKILSVYNADIYKELYQHPVCGTPRIVEYLEENDQLILIESYISGQTLAHHMKNSCLDLSSVLSYMMELCDILCQLHGRKPPIIHRDIKPSNIIITECNHVVLLDFNAAKQYSAASSQDTVLLGTKGYAAPEQYGFGSSSPQTDIYAAGILLKELITSLTDIPAELVDIVEKCIELKPADRFKTASELKEALERLGKKKTIKAGRMTKTSAEFQPVKTNKTTDTVSGWRTFLLPGFRTFTGWKMLLAIPSYLLFFWLSLSLEIEDVSKAELWLERIFCLLVFLSVIFGTCNYRNIQHFLPLCKSRYRMVRYVGIVLLDFMLAAFLMLLLILLLDLFIW